MFCTCNGLLKRTVKTLTNISCLVLLDSVLWPAGREMTVLWAWTSGLLSLLILLCDDSLTSTKLPIRIYFISPRIAWRWLELIDFPTQSRDVSERIFGQENFSFCAALFREVTYRMKCIPCLRHSDCVMLYDDHALDWGPTFEWLNADHWYFINISILSCAR